VFALALAAALTVPSGFAIQRVATVEGARELAFGTHGDLYVATRSSDIYVIPHAGEGTAGAPRIYVSIDDAPVSGVAFAGGVLYAGSQHAIWRIQGGHAQKIAEIRTGEPPAASDGDVHRTTSVTSDGTHLYASVGSSCNACVETDPTRATIGVVRNGRYTAIARRIRNAIALAVEPATHDLWASDAGQDELAPYHPYEFFDDVSAHAPADYGWPFCYENGKRKPGTDQSCAKVVKPLVIFPAYETPIGAVFYPAGAKGPFAFPSRYRGGAFVTLHGSWHGPSQGLAGYVPPRVVFVPMRDGKPITPADWNDPSKQWTQFIGGYQAGETAQRFGRPTGIAVGPQGDLFVADDLTGAIYRIRPQ
jgi:glucose/arabinose dehydrogenase